jgi:outer membrane lipoprotein-sorting protein
MTKRTGWLLVGGILFGFSRAAAAADDVEALEKKVRAAWEKHRSLTAKVTLVQPLSAAAGAPVQKGEGTFEVMKKDGKVFSRLEMDIAFDQPGAGQTRTVNQHLLMVVDGEHQYSLINLMGQNQAWKANIDPKTAGDPTGLLADLPKNFKLKVLPEETLDGQKVYVLEATKAGRNLFYFLQESGALAKLVSYGREPTTQSQPAAGATPEGKALMTYTYSDFKYDVPIARERFVFEPPPGVPIADRTNLTTRPATEKREPTTQTRPAAGEMKEREGEKKEPAGEKKP